MPSQTLAPGYLSKLRRFIDSTPSYESVRGQSASRPSAAMDAAAGAGDGGGDTQAPLVFRMDVLGHILFAYTADQSGKMTPDVTAKFSECEVLLGAMTAALASKSKTLFDSDAVRQLLMGCGDFINMGITDKNFQSSDTTVSLDLEMVADVLGSFVGLEGLAAENVVTKIAKAAVGNVGKQLLTVSTDTTKKDSKVGHLMLFGQDMMGTAIVSLSYFYTSFAESMTNIKTPCFQTHSDSVQITYHQEDYYFLSPATIAKYSPGLAADDKAYQAVIDKLSGLVKS